MSRRKLLSCFQKRLLLLEQEWVCRNEDTGERIGMSLLRMSNASVLIKRNNNDSKSKEWYVICFFF